MPAADKAAFIAGWKEAELYEKLGPATEARILQAYDKWSDEHYVDAWPETAVLCLHCDARAVINLDGRLTCLSCGASKAKT